MTTSLSVASDLDPPRARSFDVLVKSLPVAAVLLPGLGVLVRWIGFRADPAIPTYVSVAASLGDLTIVGLSSLVYSLTPLAFSYAVSSRTARATSVITEMRKRLGALEPRTRNLPVETQWAGLVERHDALDARYEALMKEIRAKGEESPEMLAESQRLLDAYGSLGADVKEHSERQTEALARISETETEIAEIKRLQAEYETIFPKWFNRGFGAIGARLGPFLNTKFGGPAIVAFYVALASVIPAFPAGVIAVVGAGIGSVMFDRVGRRLGRLTFDAVAPAVLVVLITGAISHGLQPYQPRPSYVSFAPDAGLPTGWYAELGRDSDRLYLRPCEPRGASTVNVRSELVRLIQMPAPASVPLAPNLIGVITGTPMSFGVSPGCSAHKDRP